MRLLMYRFSAVAMSRASSAVACACAADAPHSSSAPGSARRNAAHGLHRRTACGQRNQSRHHQLTHLLYDRAQIIAIEHHPAFGGDLELIDMHRLASVVDVLGAESLDDRKSGRGLAAEIR